MSVFKGESANEVIDAFFANMFFVYLAYGIAQTRQISRDDFETVDNMQTLAGIFGQKVPHRMFLSQLKNMLYTDKALVTLAWQIQNIIRFHKDADKYWKELKNIQLPGNWDRLTVQAAHTKIVELEKRFHLNPVTMLPRDGYYMENYLDFRAFRTQAIKLGVGEFAVFKNLDDLYTTSFPRKSVLNPTSRVIKSYVGGKVGCFSLNDPNANNYLLTPGIVIAR